MMDKNNIIFGKTLDEYKQKYKHIKYRLLKHTQKAVDDFDKLHGTRNYLLKDRRWYFINDVYYEAPNAPRYTWFRSLPIKAQILTCSFLGCGVITAVAVPTIIAVTNKTEYIKFDDASSFIDITDKNAQKQIKEATIVKVTTDTDGSKVFNISFNNTQINHDYEFTNNVIAKVVDPDDSTKSTILKKDVDYTVVTKDDGSQEIKIKPETVAEHKGNIQITPVIKKSVFFNISTELSDGVASFTVNANAKVGFNVNVVANASLGYKVNEIKVEKEDGTYLVTTIANSSGQFKMPEYNVKIKAAASIITYHIDYDLNGGTLAKSNPSEYTVLSETITLSDPSKVGNDYEGWFDNSEFSGERIFSIPKGSVGDKHLYAKFTPRVHNISKGEAPVGISTFEVQPTGKYDETVKINVVPSIGYSIGTLSVTKTGDPQTKVTISDNSFKMPDFDVSVSVTAVVANYNITYYNVLDSEHSNPKKYTIESETITFSDATRLGNTFNGWFSDSDLKTPITEIAKGSYGDKNIYCKFTPNTYHSGKGTVSDKIVVKSFPETGVYDTSFEIEIEVTDGYAPSVHVYNKTTPTEGFDVSPKLIEGKRYSITFKVPAYDFMVNLSTAAIKYKITYLNIDGATLGADTPKEYTTDKDTKLVNATKKGHQFLGWFTQSEGGDKVESIVKGTTGDLSFYAHWQIDTYKITVTSSDTSKGTVEGAGDFNYGTEVTVKATAKDKCEFLGWYSDNTYQKKVSGDATYKFTAEKDIDLYAKFEYSEMEIIVESSSLERGLVSGGGKYKPGASVTITATAKQYNAFKGWYSDKGYTKLISTDASLTFTVTADCNRTYYGKFYNIKDKFVDILKEQFNNQKTDKYEYDQNQITVNYIDGGIDSVYNVWYDHGACRGILKYWKPGVEHWHETASEIEFRYTLQRLEYIDYSIKNCDANNSYTFTNDYIEYTSSDADMTKVKVDKYGFIIDFNYRQPTEYCVGFNFTYSGSPHKGS